MSLNGIVLSCPSKANKNAHPKEKEKKSVWRLVRPGGDSGGQGSGPKAWVAPLGHAGIKERLFQTGSCREEGSRAVAGRPSSLLSVRQRMAVSGGRGRAGDDWFMGWLAGCVWTCVVCVCVCVPCSGWQIGKATDGPGSISTAGCCDVSILPSLTTASQSRAVCVIARTCGCVLLSLPQLWVCCFKIRSAITLFANYNKGKSLSWRRCCRTMSTANNFTENTGTQLLVMPLLRIVLLFVCVCARQWMILGVTVHICARVVCAYCFCLQMLAHSHSWPGQDNGKA